MDSLALVQDCACGRPATSGSTRGECGTCYRQRLAGIRIDFSSFDSRPSMHSYYDREALDEQFGGAAGKEQMMDATQGLGPGRRDPKSGRLMRWDRKTKEHVPITEKEIKTVYANGPEIADPFA